MIFNFLDGLLCFSRNPTVKAMSIVLASVISEIFMYMILGLSCVFTSLIIQVHDLIENTSDKAVGNVGGDAEIVTNVLS